MAHLGTQRRSWLIIVSRHFAQSPLFWDRHFAALSSCSSTFFINPTHTCTNIKLKNPPPDTATHKQVLNLGSLSCTTAFTPSLQSKANWSWLVHRATAILLPPFTLAASLWNPWFDFAITLQKLTCKQLSAFSSIIHHLLQLCFQTNWATISKWILHHLQPLPRYLTILPSVI